MLARTARRVRHGSDARAVRQLRVATRRLASSLDLWQPLLKERPALRARRHARRIRRQLSRHRNLEVLRAECAARLPAASPEVRAVLESLLARIGRRLGRERSALTHAAATHRIAKLERAVHRALHTGRRHAPTATPALAGRHASLMRERALEAFEAARRSGDDEAFHDARVRIKRWRYAEESAALRADTAAGQPDSPLAAGLRDLQKALGRVQDLALLRRFYERRLERALRNANDVRTRALEALLGQVAAERTAAAETVQRRSTTLSEVAGFEPRGVRG